MKLVYNLLVLENCTARVETLFNRLRVGLNDWDRSKVFELNGTRLVNYTIVCTREQYDSIKESMYNV